MSGSVDGPWPSNRPNPPTGDSGPDAPDSGSGAGGETGDDDPPTVRERVREFRRKYPGRAATPLSQTDGRALRRELTEAEWVEYEAESDRGPGTERAAYEAERRALTWEAAVEGLLSSHIGYQDARLRLERGRPGREDRETFDADLSDSWGPEAQRETYAQLRALERETVGYAECDEGCGHYCERPEDHDTEWVAGRYDDPCLGLITLTASAVPDGERLPPVDHLAARRSTWGGRDGVRRKLRDVMSRKLGLSGDESVYWRQTEPHPGDGPNACHGHDHIMVVFDRAAVDGDPSLGTVEDLLRAVVDRHAERCAYAGESGHGESAVDVRAVGDSGDDVRSLAPYLAEYIAVDPDKTLLERSTEFIAWAATLWAANKNKRSRSVSAGDAIDADACRQRYAAPDTDQDRAHGEVARHDAKSDEWVCAECGSSWGVDAGAEGVETVSQAALDGDESTEPAPAVAKRWPSARAAASVSSPVTDGDESGEGGDETAADPEVSGVDRPPEWRAVAIVRGEGEDAEEHPVGRGGVDMAELRLPTVDGRPLWDRPDGARWRCAICGVATYDRGAAQRHAGEHEGPPVDFIYHDYPDKDMGDYPDRYGPAGPARPASDGEGAGESDGDPTADDSGREAWMCKCQCYNGAERDECVSCGAARPTPDPDGGDGLDGPDDEWWRAAD